MLESQHWLMKSEPDVYGIDRLAREGSVQWEGVRSYQARNYMVRMRVGDRVLFYHSNAEPSGVVGLARVVREAYPDSFSWDPKSDYFDPASTRESPRWFMVDVEFVEKFPRALSLEALKGEPRLSDMVVTRKGSRLSVQPVEPSHFDFVVAWGRSGRPPKGPIARTAGWTPPPATAPELGARAPKKPVRAAAKKTAAKKTAASKKSTGRKGR